MILSPQEQTAEKWGFPSETCVFLPKDALSYGKNSGFLQKNGTCLQTNVVFKGALQETAGICRRIPELKNRER